MLRWIKKLFHRSKQDTSMQDINRLLIPSVLGICFCAVCLAGGTFAWFSATTTTTTTPIQTASYDATAELDGVVAEGLVALSSGEHRITLTAQGTAGGGYCILRLEREGSVTELHTAPILPGEHMTLSITVMENATLEIIPQWGASSQQESQWITPERGYIEPTT